MIELEFINPFQKYSGITTTDTFINIMAKEIKDILYKKGIRENEYKELVLEDDVNKLENDQEFAKVKRFSIMLAKMYLSTKIVLSKNFVERKDYFKNFEVNEYKQMDLFNPEFRSLYTTINFEDLKIVFSISKAVMKGTTYYEYVVFDIRSTKAILNFYTIKGKEPRVFIECPNMIKDCGHYRPVKINPYEYLCCKTPRTIHVCDYFKDTECFHTEIIFKYMNLAKDTAKALTKKDKKYKITRVDRDTNIKKEIEEAEYKNDYISIYVPKKEVETFERYYKIKRKGTIGTLKSEHVRRSHKRRLKNGKVIEVKSATINKGKGEKPYYIK